MCIDPEVAHDRTEVLGRIACPASMLMRTLRQFRAAPFIGLDDALPFSKVGFQPRRLGTQERIHPRGRAIVPLSWSERPATVLDCVRFLITAPRVVGQIGLGRPDEREGTMARRRLLTGEHWAGLLALPTDERDVVRHCTLAPDDLAVLAAKRADHNRVTEPPNRTL
jgi:hypothetical protein